MKKLMLLAAMLTLVVVAASPALAQSGSSAADVQYGNPAPPAPAPKAQAGAAQAGGSSSGGGAQAEAPKTLPATGGVAGLIALGAGALLVSGGLVARRIIK